MSIFNSRKKARKEIKDLFELLMMPKRKELDTKWAEMNFHLIEDIFTNKLKVGIIENSEKSRHYHEGIIDKITLNANELRIDSKDFGVITFYNPSHYFLEIAKGVGNMYSLTITSEKNAPSQLELFYENL